MGGENEAKTDGLSSRIGERRVGGGISGARHMAEGSPKKKTTSNGGPPTRVRLVEGVLKRAIAVGVVVVVGVGRV